MFAFVPFWFGSFKRFLSILGRDCRFFQVFTQAAVWHTIHVHPCCIVIDWLLRNDVRSKPGGLIRSFSPTWEKEICRWCHTHPPCLKHVACLILDLLGLKSEENNRAAQDLRPFRVLIITSHFLNLVFPPALVYYHQITPFSLKSRWSSADRFAFICNLLRLKIVLLI